METVEKAEGKVIKYKTKMVGTCATQREMKLAWRTGKERKAKLKLYHGKG